MNWETLLNRSYAPYSGTPDACIVQSTGDNFYAGTRIENSSFPLTISALQSAICQCLSEGDIPQTVFIPAIDKLNTAERAYWQHEFDLEYNITSSLNFIDAFYTPLEKKPRDLELHLHGLLKKAVIPNSNFPVAAILETKEHIITGVNVEFADWSRGLCAERVALSKALARGITTYSTLHILTVKGEYCSPCGACRQVLTEHLRNVPLQLYHPDGTQSAHYVHHLLPHNFTANKEVFILK